MNEADMFWSIVLVFGQAAIAYYCAKLIAFLIIDKWQSHIISKRDERPKEYQNNILLKYKNGSAWGETKNIRKEQCEMYSKCNTKSEL